MRGLRHWWWSLRGETRRATAMGLSIAWVFLLIAVQYSLDDRLVVVPWLALGPLAVSLVLPWRPVAVVALLSVLAVAGLSRFVAEDLWSRQGQIRVAGSTALAAFAILSAEIRTRREERVRRVTEVAVVAQATILHPVPAAVDGLSLASRYVSASADALVGGDLYDVVATQGGVRLLLGDARGKGLQAVQTAATVLSAFRSAAPRPGVTLEDLAREMEAALKARLLDEDFVTAVLCEISRDEHTLTLVNCGHPQPLLLAPGTAATLLGTHASPPLGLGVDPVAERFEIGGGSRVLLYTDGLIEARDERGDFYDLRAAAGLVAPTPGYSGPSALDDGLERLMDSLRSHVGGGLTDDVAVLLVELPRS